MTVPVAGIRALRKIQLGKETTPGGAGTVNTRLVGKLGMKLDQKYYRPEDLETGRLSSYERSFIVGEQAALPFEADATYEQLPFLLSMSVKGGISGVLSAEGQYVWTFLPNLTAANSPTTFTFEYGDDIRRFQSLYCYSPNL